MKLTPDSDTPNFSHSSQRRRLAQRVADAHRNIDDGTLLAWVTGSVVEGLADAQSDVNLALIWAEDQPPEVLRQACAHAGGEGWHPEHGPDGRLRGVRFQADGIEVQLAYGTHAALDTVLDELLLRHRPDGPAHEWGDAMVRAEPLFGHRPLQALQGRLAQFPPELALAMVRHHLASTPDWPRMARMAAHDASPWCRLQQAQACLGLLGMLAALNGRYFPPHRFQRLQRFAATLEQAPPVLAGRLESLLSAPPLAAARALHALQGEVLARVAERWPALDLSALRDARDRFEPH